MTLNEFFEWNETKRNERLSKNKINTHTNTQIKWKSKVNKITRMRERERGDGEIHWSIGRLDIPAVWTVVMFHHLDHLDIFKTNRLLPISLHFTLRCSRKISYQIPLFVLGKILSSKQSFDVHFDFNATANFFFTSRWCLFRVRENAFCTKIQVNNRKWNGTTAN